MLALLCLVAMPIVWTGETLDGVLCKLNSENGKGLVAYVGLGGKRTMPRVANRHTSLTECVAAMEKVLDRSPKPATLPADLNTILCGLPLFAGNASKAVRRALKSYHCPRET